MLITNYGSWIFSFVSFVIGAKMRPMLTPVLHPIMKVSLCCSRPLLGMTVLGPKSAAHDIM